ncbi:hypothetical protein THOM_0986 [Trachipleistophora hominis]|uniref:Uncharacterized protein n=1 Tax=Trachipleistophora hominis TaxID=72359 RepID=L7JXI8_TRAHO|nr:hypothetical protein THOM_0986 [Trachipleistophora hominis]
MELHICFCLFLSFISDIMCSNINETEQFSSDTYTNPNETHIVYYSAKFRGRTLKIRCKLPSTHVTIVPPDVLIGVTKFADTVASILNKKFEDRTLSDYLNILDILFVLEKCLCVILEDIQQGQQEYFDMAQDVFLSFQDQENYRSIISQLDEAYSNHLKSKQECLNALRYGVCSLIELSGVNTENGIINRVLINKLVTSMSPYFQETPVTYDDLVSSYQAITSQHNAYHEYFVNDTSMLKLAGYMTEDNDPDLLEILENIRRIILNE